MEKRELKSAQYVCVNEKETCVTVKLQGVKIVKVDVFKYLVMWGQSPKAMNIVQIRLIRECSQGFLVTEE